MSPEIRALHTRAQVLLAACPDTLSLFEANLIADIGLRRLQLQEEAIVTINEEVALRHAVEAMEKALQRAFHDNRLEFGRLLDHVAAQPGVGYPDPIVRTHGDRVLRLSEMNRMTDHALMAWPEAPKFEGTNLGSFQAAAQASGEISDALALRGVTVCAIMAATWLTAWLMALIAGAS